MSIYTAPLPPNPVIPCSYFAHTNPQGLYFNHTHSYTSTTPLNVLKDGQDHSAVYSTVLSGRCFTLVLGPHIQSCMPSHSHTHAHTPDTADTIFPQRALDNQSVGLCLRHRGKLYNNLMPDSDTAAVIRFPSGIKRHE